jgi:hypothetical protein
VRHTFLRPSPSRQPLPPLCAAGRAKLHFFWLQLCLFLRQLMQVCRLPFRFLLPFSTTGTKTMPISHCWNSMPCQLFYSARFSSVAMIALLAHRKVIALLSAHQTSHNLNEKKFATALPLFAVATDRLLLTRKTRLLELLLFATILVTPAPPRRINRLFSLLTTLLRRPSVHLLPILRRIQYLPLCFRIPRHVPLYCCCYIDDNAISLRHTIL